MIRRAEAIVDWAVSLGVIAVVIMAVTVPIKHAVVNKAAAVTDNFMGINPRDNSPDVQRAYSYDNTMRSKTGSWQTQTSESLEIDRGITEGAPWSNGNVSHVDSGSRSVSSGVGQGSEALLRTFDLNTTDVSQ